MNVVMKNAMMMNLARDHSSLNQPPLWGRFTMWTGLSREPYVPGGKEGERERSREGKKTVGREGGRKMCREGERERVT